MPDTEKLLNAIDAAEADSYGSDGLSSERAAAVDRYLGKNVLPAPDGRSQVTDRSVYETIQWIKPSLCRIFANGDDVVELPPIGPEDEAGAKQEAQYLNHVVLQKNNWFEIFDTAASDALLTKAGYLYPYKEKRRQIEMEKYERQTKESLALIIQDGVEVIDLKEYPDTESPPQVDPMTGQPIPSMLYDVEIRRTKEEVSYCIDVLPPERCKIAESTKTVQLKSSSYFEYYDYITISELREMGFDVEDDIADSDGHDTEEDDARDQYSEQTGYDDENEIDPAMRKVKCRWIWIKHDYDEDGIAELQYVIRVGQKILHREEVNRIPVAVICPDPLPHRHVGLCPADGVSDIQDIKTAILRQGLDNLYLSNNPPKFGNPSLVNLDDMLVSRPGGVWRTKGGVFGQDFGAVPLPFVFPQAMEGLEYMDQIRENRTGTNRYFTGIDQNALNKTATGIQQLSTMAAQRVEQIARHFANGIEELFSILHELILKGGHKAEVVKLSGQWVPVDPSTWRSRTDFRISVGFAAGNKDAMVSRLMLIANAQKEARMGGLTIVQDQNIYETMMELTKASDFSAPHRFWTDPKDAPPPQPPQPDVTVMAAEQLKSQTAVQTKQLDVEQKERDSQRGFAIKKFEIETQAQSALEAEQLRIQSAHSLEDRKAQNTAGIKQIEGSQAAQLKEREIQMKQAPALEMAGQVQQLSAKLEDAIGSLQEALATVLTAKRQIRRGKDGKAEGVDVIGPDGAVIASQSVQRGPDGRIAGAG
jgi:hypothetical protein